MRFAHTLNRIATTFDDGRLIANAGLLLPATLAQHLGLRELFDRHVDLGSNPLAARAAAIRRSPSSCPPSPAVPASTTPTRCAGGSAAALGHELRASSTLGTFLRSFS